MRRPPWHNNLLTVLQERFMEAVKEGYLRDILDEIITQSRVEFNYEDDSA
jgi:hypothetical protein